MIELNFLRPTKRRRRRGMALLIVLGMLALVLAVSYVMLHRQTTTSQIANNFDRQKEARLAANAGLRVALRKMSESTWVGVGTNVSGNAGTSSSYVVTLTPGDASLQPTDEDYAEYPFRVTLSSVGTAADPSNPALTSEHTAVAVVQLVRRSFAAQPASWTALQSATVNHWSNSSCLITLPIRVSGTMRMHGGIDLMNVYPPTVGQRHRFAADTKALFDASINDVRPFPDTIQLNTGYCSADDFAYLQSDLQATYQNISVGGTSPVSHPGTVTSYQLYAGGPSYVVEVLPSSLQNVSYAPDPITNPLGLFRGTDNIDIYDDVSVTGTIITYGRDLRLRGTNVKLKAAELRGLSGATTTQQLPCAVIGDDFYVESPATARIEGATIAMDNYGVKTRQTAANSFQQQGRIWARNFYSEGNNWEFTAATWNSIYTLFNAQLGYSNSDPYYPRWLESTFGLAMEPIINFGPATSPTQYVWPDWSAPIYQPAAGDEGLIWEVIRWR